VLLTVVRGRGELYEGARRTGIATSGPRARNRLSNENNPHLPNPTRRLLLIRNDDAKRPLWRRHRLSILGIGEEYALVRKRGV